MSSTHQQRLARLASRSYGVPYQECLRRVNVLAAEGCLPAPLDDTGMKLALNIFRLAGTVKRHNPAPVPEADNTQQPAGTTTNRDLRAPDRAWCPLCNTAMDSFGRDFICPSCGSKTKLHLSGPAFGYQQLVRYYERRGHAVVPLQERGVNIHDRSDSDYHALNFHLGRWAAAQRDRYHHGVMSLDEIKLFEDLPGWSWEQPDPDSWVPPCLAAELGQPCQTCQDPQYQALIQHTKQEGTAHRYSLEWAARHEQQIDRELHELLATLSEQEPGRPQDLSASRPASTSLQEYAKRQRSAYRRGLVDIQVAAHFDPLPGWEWEPDDEKWELYCRSVQLSPQAAYQSLLSERCPWDGLYTAKWIADQRWAHKRGRLSAYRQARLEQIPGWTWADDTAERLAAVDQELNEIGNVEFTLEINEQDAARSRRHYALQFEQIALAEPRTLLGRARTLLRRN